MDKEDHHANKFKNRTKGRETRSFNRNMGNTTSPAGSRPGGLKCTARMNEKMINNDTEIHKTIDHHTVPTPFLSKKSSIQTIVSLDDKKKTNLQNHFKYTGEKKIKDKPKIVHLDKFAHNIFIGNFQSAFDNATLKNYGIRTIINLSDDVISDNVIRIHNIHYKDTRTLNYHDFHKILDQSVKIINANVDVNHNVLIICTKGVNRSVSIAVAYGILKGFTFEECCRYVEKRKKEKEGEYEIWDSLTNFRIRNILRSLKVGVGSALPIAPA